jgi:hypothetical protein
MTSLVDQARAFSEEVAETVARADAMREEFESKSSYWMQASNAIQTAARQFEALGRPELSDAIEGVDEAIKADLHALESSMEALGALDDEVKLRRSSCKEAMRLLLVANKLLVESSQDAKPPITDDVQPVYLHEFSEYSDVNAQGEATADERVAAACSKLVHHSLTSWDLRDVRPSTKAPRVLKARVVSSGTGGVLNC